MKLTATQISVQMPASRIDTLWAPCRLSAKKSTSRATTTKAANSDQSNGVPMEITGRHLWLRTQEMNSLFRSRQPRRRRVPQCRERKREASSSVLTTLQER